MSDIAGALDSETPPEADVLYNFIRVERALREAVQFCEGLKAGSRAMTDRLTAAADVCEPLMVACATQIAKIQAAQEAAANE